MSEPICQAAANFNGEHISCDWIEQNMEEGTTEHRGWAHSNQEHHLIWACRGDFV